MTDYPIPVPMPADFDGLTCPRCGAASLSTPDGQRYCSFIGSREQDIPACTWGLGQYDRGPNEGRPIPPSCPAGHPAACIVSNDEGTAHCRWCEEVGRLRGAFNTAVDYQQAAESAIAEKDALLALYSGGKAGKMPDGKWSFGAELGMPRMPFMFARTGRGAVVSVYADGRWVTSFPRGGGVGDANPGPRPILTAIAEALAWLKAQETRDAPR